MSHQLFAVQSKCVFDLFTNDVPLFNYYMHPTTLLHHYDTFVYIAITQIFAQQVFFISTMMLFSTYFLLILHCKPTIRFF